MAFQYVTVNSGDMSTHYHARSLIKIGISQGIEKGKLIYQVDLMIKKVKKEKALHRLLMNWNAQRMRSGHVMTLLFLPGRNMT